MMKEEIKVFCPVFACFTSCRAITKQNRQENVKKPDPSYFRCLKSEKKCSRFLCPETEVIQKCVRISFFVFFLLRICLGIF